MALLTKQQQPKKKKKRKKFDVWQSVCCGNKFYLKKIFISDIRMCSFAHYNKYFIGIFRARVTSVESGSYVLDDNSSKQGYLTSYVCPKDLQPLLTKVRYNVFYLKSKTSQKSKFRIIFHLIPRIIIQVKSFYAYSFLGG